VGEQRQKAVSWNHTLTHDMPLVSMTSTHTTDTYRQFGRFLYIFSERIFDDYCQSFSSFDLIGLPLFLRVEGWGVGGGGWVR